MRETSKAIRHPSSQNGLPQSHPGVPFLLAENSPLNPARNQWRDQVRNKVCAHMDLDVPAAMLEMANWPVAPQAFHDAVEQLCTIVVRAAEMDVRTKLMATPATPLKGVLGLARVNAPNWADT